MPPQLRRTPSLLLHETLKGFEGADEIVVAALFDEVEVGPARRTVLD